MTLRALPRRNVWFGGAKPAKTLQMRTVMALAIAKVAPYSLFAWMVRGLLRFSIWQQLIERVNIYFGYGAVSELRLIQGPVRRNEQPRHVPEEPPAEPEDLPETIEDEAPRNALGRLAVNRRS